MVGITNVCAASPGEAYAALIITYTAGATCYVSDGSKTLYAKGTSGSEVFFVPNAGTWSIYLNEVRKRQVSISYEGQSLAYSIS